MVAQVCQACGSALQTITYQARSADEAHRTIETCAQCPIDMSKVVLSPRKLPNNVRFTRHTRASSSTKSISCIRRKRVTELSFEVQGEPTDLKFSRLIVRTRPVRETPESIPTTCREMCTPTMEGRFLSESAKEPDAGMGISVVTHTEYITYGKVDDGRVEVAGEYAVVTIQGVGQCLVVRERCDRGYDTSVKVFLDDNDKSAGIGSIIFHVYRSGYCLKNIRRHISTDTLKHAINLSSRAWDVPFSEVIGYPGTTKVDGERMLIVCMGYTAYFIRRDTSCDTRHWTCMEWHSTGETGGTCIFDVEYSQRDGYAIIDVLLTSKGVFAEPNRTMEWVHSQATAHRNILSELGVYMREYRIIEWGDKHLTRGDSTSDGLVAIHPMDVGARKIKEVKSTELAVSSGADSLVSVEGSEIFGGLKPPSTSLPGEIFEVRFTPTTRSSATVMELFRRVDKRKANTNTVINDIISSASANERYSENNERRRALLWCNSLSKYVNTLVESMNTPKPIIIDVGSGDGQSLDCMNIDGSTHSRLLIEPDSSKCERLCRRLGLKVPVKGIEHVRSRVRRLVTRSDSVVVCNSTLEDVMNDDDLINELFPSVRAIVGTFSFHFVVEPLLQLILATHIPVYGCGYVYDNIQADETLIDACGVRMKRINAEDCEVRWGGDKVYVEPHVTSNDYGTFSTVSEPSDVCSDFALRDEPYTKICKHIRLFTPR